MEDLDCISRVRKFEVLYIDNINDNEISGAYVNKITYTKKFFDALGALN